MQVCPLAGTGRVHYLKPFCELASRGRVLVFVCVADMFVSVCYCYSCSHRTCYQEMMRKGYVFELSSLLTNTLIHNGPMNKIHIIWIPHTAFVFITAGSVINA